MLQTIQQTDASHIMRAIQQMAVRDGITAAEIITRLGRIEEKVEKKIAYRKVEDAVREYKEFIYQTHRQPDTNIAVINRFLPHFSGKNMAEITADEIQGFLLANWAHCKGTSFNNALRKVSSLFGHCIKQLKRRGSPEFHNPCSLVDPAKEQPKKQKEFTKIDKIRELLDSFTKEHYWLWYNMLFTSGMRCRDLGDLRPMDVNGRVLHLVVYKENTKNGREVGPKSGKEEEFAVIPQVVADRLSEYIKELPPDKPIWGTKNSSLDVNMNRVLKKYCLKVGIEPLTIHEARKWVSTYWDRKGIPSMKRFVLRHSGNDEDLTKLERRYILGCSVDEACRLQDEHLVKDLFGNAKNKEGL